MTDRPPGRKSKGAELPNAKLVIEVMIIRVGRIPAESDGTDRWNVGYTQLWQFGPVITATGIFPAAPERVSVCNVSLRAQNNGRTVERLDGLGSSAWGIPSNVPVYV